MNSSPHMHPYALTGNPFGLTFPNSNNESLNYLHLCNNGFNNSGTTQSAKGEEEHSKHSNHVDKFSTFDSIPPSDFEKNSEYNVENANECLKNLQMIHEQNETAMHSSTSSSICSSESTTPRLNRSSLVLDRRTSLDCDNDEQTRMFLKSNRKKSNASVSQNTPNYAKYDLPVPLSQYFSQSMLNNFMVTNNTNENGILDPTRCDHFRNSNNNDENEQLGNTSQYLNLSRKNENSIINFSNENESEAILN